MSLLLELAQHGLVFKEHQTSVSSFNQMLPKLKGSQERQKQVEEGLFALLGTKSTPCCCGPAYLNRQQRQMRAALLKVHWKTYHWILKTEDEHRQNKRDVSVCQRHSLVLEVTGYLADGKQINE